MTNVLIAPVGDAGEWVGLYDRWAKGWPDPAELVYVLAAATTDVAPFEHVATEASPSDVLSALADIASETRGSLTVVDARRSDYAQLVFGWNAGPGERSQLLTGGPRDAAIVVQISHTDIAAADTGWRRATRASGNSDDDSPNNSHENSANDSPSNSDDLVGLAAASLLDGGIDWVRNHEFATSRPGLYVRAAVRPGTRSLLRRARSMGFEPLSFVALTTASVLAAAVVAAAGTRLGLIIAAVILQLAVVSDVVADGLSPTPTPGERRRQFTAWLNRVAAPVQFAILLGGLAIGGSRTDNDIWLLAAAGLALWVGRSILTLSYDVRLNTVVRLNTEVRLNARADEHPTMSALSLPTAEIYLVMSLTMLFGNEYWVLWVASGLLAVSLTYVLLRQLLKPPNTAHAPRLSAEVNAKLFTCSDPGPLAVAVGLEDPQLSLLRCVVASRAGWLVPLATWIIEVVVVTALSLLKESDVLPLVFLLIAVTGFHRIDTIVRLLQWGKQPAAWLPFVTLGALGRPVVYLLLAATGILDNGLAIVTLVLAAVFAAEAAGNWAADARSDVER